MMNDHHALFVLFLLLVGGVGGCDRERTDAEAPAIPRMVTHVLHDTPELVLGTEPHPLHEVRAGILHGSRIVIAESSTNRLHFYDHGGGREHSIGGTGRGPGEFARLWWVQGVGEQLYAYDLELRRITRFSGDGQHRDDMRLAPHTPGRLPGAIGMFEDGSVLVEETAPRSPVGEPSVSRGEHMLWRISWGGSQRTFLDTYKGTEVFVEPRPGGGGRTTPLPFGRPSSVAVHGEVAYVVENDRDAIRRLHLEGEELDPMRPTPRIVREAVDQETLRLARQHFVEREGLGGDRGARFDAMPVPDSLPYYGWEGFPRPRVMRAASTGRTWVLRHGGLLPDVLRWLVFDENGQQVREVASPHQHLDLLDSDGEFALVRRWSDLGEEFVELRRIVPLRD